MKKSLIALSLTTVISFTPIFAQAIDGTINFEGSVEDSTCSASVTDGNGNNKTVQMGSVQTSSLQNANDTAGGATFTISVTDSASGGAGNCDLTGKTGSVRFTSMSGTAGDNQQYIKLKADGGKEAKNVAIRLLDSNNAELLMGKDSPEYSLEKPLSFQAQYVALGQAQAGSADGKVGFIISYK